jgi:LDH2 family malate/lactate/ureidoglycolate dehydrogenase
MTRADLNGADGHGIFRLPQYVRRIKAGAVNVTPSVRIEREMAGMALVDGDNGMGHVVMKFAAETAIAKAKTAGIAWVGVHHSNHAGPASLYAAMPLAQDMIGLYLAVGNANHMAPWGGIDMLLSTNPIAVAVPGLEEGPVVLDMATTVAAYGKVKTKAQRGEMMPEGWMIDYQGKPLTDPKKSNEGMLLPLGGHEGGYKGYGLSLVFGLLAGTLNGAALGSRTVDFNADDSSVTDTGHTIVAISLEAFGEINAIKRDVDRVVRELRASRRLPGVSRVWLPGEQSQAKLAERTRDGVPVPPALLVALNTLASDLGIPALG